MGCINYVWTTFVHVHIAVVAVHVHIAVVAVHANGQSRSHIYTH